jgi:hypothetical protein
VNWGFKAGICNLICWAKDWLVGCDDKMLKDSNSHESLSQYASYSYSSSTQPCSISSLPVASGYWENTRLLSIVFTLLLLTRRALRYDNILNQYDAPFIRRVLNFDLCIHGTTFSCSWPLYKRTGSRWGDLRTGQLV